MRKTLNIIGCGKVGKVLGRLWNDNGTFIIQDVVNRSIDSAAKATAFISAGRPVRQVDDLRPADVHLIATPDDDIASMCRQLCGSALLQTGNIVFHCSGALASSALRPILPGEIAVGSAHPIRSFADPAETAANFAGTFCGIEGDEAALELLRPAFSAIGAEVVAIDPEFKSIYHSAAVFSSNYLVTLLDVALNAYEKAGIAPDTALRLMEPLVRGTVDNVFRLGPTDALTGPIARGDTATVTRQYRAVRIWDDRYGSLYDQLAKLTADIATRKNVRQS